jgi:hypothetical protein
MTIPETRYAMAPDGVYIAYQVIGDGPPDLVWFDGARGNLEVMCEQPLVAELFMKLAARCRVVRLDMRGTGLSDRGDRAPNLETQMEDARVVLDVIGSHRTGGRRAQLGMRSGQPVRRHLPQAHHGARARRGAGSERLGGALPVGVRERPAGSFAADDRLRLGYGGALDSVNNVPWELQHPAVRPRPQVLPTRPGLQHRFQQRDLELRYRRHR